MKKLLSLLVSLFFVSVALAQENVTISDQQSGLRANEKIWVVMAVCVTILAGLIVYLVSIDRKISKMEKE